MSSGGSNGSLGPFVGSVTQVFHDDVNFTNAVELGPFKILLNAKREVMDERRIKVKFVNTTVWMFGLKLLDKKTEGQGVWKIRYFSLDPSTGKMIRIMDTPSLFVIEERE